MVHLIPVVFLVVSVPLLVRAEIKNNKSQVHVLKPLSTVLVIAVASLSFLLPSAQPAFTLWLVVGLVLSLGGDVALMLESDRAFLIGLILFLLAHVIYAIAFTVPNGFHSADIIAGMVMLAIGILMYLYLRPGLGSMNVPVILYTLIICFMVSRAISTFFGSAFTFTQAWLLSFGAVFFMVSDIVLAVNRFRQPIAKHRLSLFAYYLGQLLIALSPAYFC